MTQINLAELTNDGQVHNLAGHERGVEARAKFNLDSLDKAAENVVVVVPEDVYLLSPSFIQGMFADSVKALGGREAFLAHYGFDAPSLILTQIDSGIDATLMDRGPLVKN